MPLSIAPGSGPGTPGGDRSESLIAYGTHAGRSTRTVTA